MVPWMNPDNGSIRRYISLESLPDAKKAGWPLRRVICVPDESGVYAAYDQRGDIDEEGVATYMSAEVKCPWFLKCDACPARQAAAVIELSQLDIVE